PLHGIPPAWCWRAAGCGHNFTLTPGEGVALTCVKAARGSERSLLARLAFGVVDGAELARRLRRPLARPHAGGAEAAMGRHGVQLPALARGLLGAGGRERAQVVGGLQAPQP